MRNLGTSVVVTDTARPLGLALAERLAARGDRVVIVGRAAAEADEVVARIRAGGGVAHAVVADLADPSAIGDLARSVEVLAGPIEVVVHDASTPTSDTAAVEGRDPATEMVGAMRLSRALAVAMAERGHGALVLLSSADCDGWRQDAATRGTTAALGLIAHAHAARLGASGIRSIAVVAACADAHSSVGGAIARRRVLARAPAIRAARIAALIDDPSRAPNGSRLVV